MEIYLFILLFVFLIIGVPIAFATAASVLIVLILWGEVSLTMLFQQMYQGVDSFTLLALPLFMLAGELMMRLGIIDDILLLCNVLVGKLRGGLAHVNIVSSMFFAGISGSAVSDTAAIGSVLIPSMKKNGYSAEFSVAVTAASSVIGPIIPPSIAMILYGSIVPVSISGLFAGGIVPGVLIGVGMMLVAGIISKKKNYPVSYKKYTPKELRNALLRAIPAILMPIIILGGILFGVVTPTEASAIACVYGLLIGALYYKKVNFKVLYDSLISSGRVSGNVLLMVAAATPLGWIIAMAQVPQKLVDLVTSISTNPFIILLLLNIIILILGSLLDANINVLIFAPILAPVAMAAGVDPLHFGIIFVINVVIGLATPPFGMCMFVGAAVAKIPVESVMKPILPFVGVQVAVLILITYIPPLTLAIPKLIGLY